uniref:Reverse transcriptase n=1 Tax=Peronospora matthiolae TaxID=2874970 RepID=A0AAV1TG91_9STRA
MQEEIAALETNDVWRVMKHSPEANALHSKWADKTKPGVDGELKRYKARLVACGNKKVVLALVATWDVPTKYGDIPKAYLLAEKEAHLDIFLQVPREMSVSERTLRKTELRIKARSSWC